MCVHETETHPDRRSGFSIIRISNPRSVVVAVSQVILIFGVGPSTNPGTWSESHHKNIPPPGIARSALPAADRSGCTGKGLLRHSPSVPSFPDLQFINDPGFEKRLVRYTPGARQRREKSVLFALGESSASHLHACSRPAGNGRRNCRKHVRYSFVAPFVASPNCSSPIVLPANSSCTLLLRKPVL
jgi:hypothetical protein